MAAFLPINTATTRRIRIPIVDTASVPRELPSDLRALRAVGGRHTQRIGLLDALGAKLRGWRWPGGIRAADGSPHAIGAVVGEMGASGGAAICGCSMSARGPVTPVGYVPPEGMTMELVATDPLADAYTRIFDSPRPAASGAQHLRPGRGVSTFLAAGLLRHRPLPQCA